MQILIEPGGNVRCVYDETIDLAVLGSLTIARGSHVEPDENGCWCADLSPVDGPRLGPFINRSLAIEAELKWLETKWLISNQQWKELADANCAGQRRSVGR